jgi:hypothetical protein
MPSSVIRSYHYFEEEQKLRITFVSGLVYDYLDVPAVLYDEFKKALSKGTFFNLYIKNQHSFVKVGSS